MQELLDLAGTASASECTFTSFVMTKNGKRRTISVPNPPLRALHARIIRAIRKATNGSSILTSTYGSLSGKSTVQNAEQHVLNRYVYQLDLRDAFRSVSIEILARVIATYGPTNCSSQIESFLETFCADTGGGLKVGAPASPALFDLYAVHMLDRAIRDCCPFDTYTRYFDDLTISSPTPIPTILRRRIRDVVHAAGFEVNHQKSRVTDRAKQSVVLTGVTLTRDRKLRPTSEFMGRVSACIADPDSVTEQVKNGLAGHMGMFARSPYGEPASLRMYRALGTRRPKVRTLNGRHSTRFLDRIRVEVPLAILPTIRSLKKFKRVGKEYVACCPFHNEKTPSFKVCPEKFFFHCFGCGEHGDVFNYVMKTEKLSFRDAVEAIVSRHCPTIERY